MIHSEILLQQQNLLKIEKLPQRVVEPYLDFAYAGDSNNQKLGQKCIEEGKVGCLLIAGGEGSRLGFDGPKGIYPLGDKSLFQLFAESVVILSHQIKRKLKIAIMTSLKNHEETVAFFEKNQLFGLDRDQLFFFTQGELPLLNQKGELFLEAHGRIAMGPDGNGGALHQFYASGIWAKWYSQGIRYLNFTLVDNPLAEPFDAELVGYQICCDSDVVIKSIERKDPLELLGVIVKENNKVAVVEYSEIPDDLRSAKNHDGTLIYNCANISLFCFKMDFISSVATNREWTMPLHKAFKAVKYLNDSGETVKADKPIAWKFERFIFDVLFVASRVNVLVYPREECFAPLKNATGPYSITTVLEALKRKKVI